MNVNLKETESDLENGFEALLESVISGSSTLGQIKGMSKEEMEAVYTIAYNLYSQNHLEESEKMFRFLCLYGHLDKRNWMGLGACLQQQKKYEGAVQAYSYLAVLDVENPEPPLHAAYCYLAMNELDRAESGIEAALHWAGTAEKYAPIRTRAELLRSALIQKREVADNACE
ncbi:MAG: SycD/LcrH family type III secretion system chaperone [Reinekea sp.]